MASVPTILVNDEKNVVDHATDHLDSDLAIFTTIVQPLQCGTQEDPRGIFEVEAAFVKVAPAFGFVPLEEHRRMYALSVVRSSPRPPIGAAAGSRSGYRSIRFHARSWSRRRSSRAPFRARRSSVRRGGDASAATIVRPG